MKLPAAQQLAGIASDKFDAATRAGRRVEYNDCFNEARREQPDLAAEMDRIATPQAIAMANERAARGKCEIFQREGSRMFLAFANERPGATWNAKWRNAEGLARDLAGLMGGEVSDPHRAVAILSNPWPCGIALANESPMPVMGPQNLALLGLPADTEPAFYVAAWIANGRQMSPRNARAILIALAEQRHKDFGGSVEAAGKYVVERFSALAREAGSKK